MRYFDKRYVFTGELYNSKSSVENIRCEVTLNEIDTSSLFASIIVLKPSTVEIEKLLNSREGINIRSKESGRYFEILGGGYNHQMSSTEGETFKVSVKRCMYQEFYSDDNPQKVYYRFHISPSQIFCRINSITFHYKKGLISGWQEKNKGWEDEKYTLTNNLGIISFEPSFVFTEIKDDAYKEGSYLVKEQLIIMHELILNSPYKENYLDKVEESVNDYLKIISFLESRRLEWFYLNVFAQSKNPYPDFEKHIYKKSTLNSLGKINIHYAINRGAYQKLLPIIVDRYQLLNKTIRKNVDKILDRFLVAVTHDKIDTCIIYWHSCLDLLIKEIVGTNKPFDLKLIKACLKSNVEWLDLFPYLSEEYIKRGNKSLVNKIRNEIIHEGKYPDNYSTIRKELRSVRALCERLILKLIGIDYKNTCVGFIHKHEY